MAANMLHTVVRNVQGLRNRVVRNVLVRGWRGVCAPEPEQQHGRLYLGLLLLRVTRKSIHFDHVFY